MVMQKTTLPFRCVVLRSFTNLPSFYAPHIQFFPSHNVLHDHWSRNGPPAPTQPMGPLSTHCGPLAPTSPTLQVVTRPRPKPTLKRVVPLTPVQEVDPVMLPPPDLSQPSLGQNGYPRVWRLFITHAEYYILRDMIFTHPFPSATEVWVGEAVSTAFKSWSFISPDPLCFNSCTSNHLPRPNHTHLHTPVNAHRPNLISLVSQELIPIYGS